MVNTDSKVTLDTLKNRNRHCILIENIRKEIKKLEDLEWTLFFNWVKAHVEIEGNERADFLAKKAAADDIGEIVYDKIPRERERDYNHRKEGEGIKKWQGQGTSSTKGAISKLYFPYIKERMKTKLPRGRVQKISGLANFLR